MTAKKCNSDKVPNTNKKPAPEKGKPKPKPVPQDQPTRKSLYDLVRRLDATNHRAWADPEYKALSGRQDERTKEVLTADPELQELERKIADVRRRADREYDSRSKKIAALRAMLEAQGVTPAVVKKANALVAEFFPETVETTNADSASADAIGGADGAQLV